MNDNEVNKIIAEYMGYHFIPEDAVCTEAYWNEERDNAIDIDHFTKSLDALIPVWKKMNSYSQNFLYAKINSEFVWIASIRIQIACITHYISSNHENKTVASAHATAKAILKLEE